MEPEIGSLDRPLPRKKIIGLILGIVALALGQAWISAVHWLQLPQNTFNSFTRISCSILPICNSRYPPYFALVLLILLLALVLLALSIRQTALRITSDVDWTISAHFTYPRRWSRLFILFAALALTATAITAYTALTAADRYPHPLLWFVAILLWGIAFYSLDRASQRPSGISYADIFSLISYILLLLILGYIYHTPALQSWVSRAAFVMVATLILFGLWRVQRISGSSAIWGLIAVVGLAIYTYRIDSWSYAFIGDEYAFYNTAKSFLSNPAAYHLLSSRGVYNSHPVFATFMQSISMLLYGGDIYSWRVGGVLMVFLSAPAIFVLVRQLTGRNAGLFAAILFVSAHHLIGFAYAGYFALQILLGFTAMLTFAVLAIQRQSILTMFLSGVSAAFTFYSYTLASPLIPLPLLLLMLWIVYPEQELSLRFRLKKALPLAVACIIGVLVTALPRAINTVWLSDAVTNTIFDHSEIANLSSPLLQQAIPNVTYTLTASLYFDFKSHYISGGHLDPLSSAFMLIGIAGLIAAAARRRTALWLLMSFFATVVVVGAFGPYPYPSHARTFFLVVFYAIFAALGAAYLWQTARDLGLRWFPISLRTTFAAAVVAVIALNAYQFFYIYPHTIQKHRIAMMVREFQVSSPDTTFYYVAPLPNDQNLMLVLDSFAFDTERLTPVMNPSPMEALSEVRRNATPPYRVLIARNMEDLRAWLEAAQTIWGERLMQEVTDDSGVIHFIALDVPD